MSSIIEDAEALRLTVAALTHVRNREQLARLIHRMATFDGVRFLGFTYWRGLEYDRPVDWCATTFPPEFHAMFGSSAALRRHKVAHRSVSDLVPVDWFEVSEELGMDHPDVRSALAMGLTRTGLSCAARGHRRNFGIFYVNFDMPEDQWKSRRLSLSACVQLISIYIHQKLVELCPELGTPDVLSTRERACISLAAEGKKVKQIAHLLGISEQTVNFYLSRARTKLGVTNTTHAAVLAAELGLVDFEEQELPPVV